MVFSSSVRRPPRARGEPIRHHELIVARHHTTTISTTDFPNGCYVLHFRPPEQHPEEWTFVNDNREQQVFIAASHRRPLRGQPA